VAKDGRRRLRNREAERSEAQDVFDRVGAARRHYAFRNPPWKDSNAFATMLSEAFMATGEPAFIEALRIGRLYGFTEAASPRKRMNKVGALRSTLEAATFVEAHLQWQRDQGKRPSFREACEVAAGEFATEAQSVEAARKRIMATLKACRSGQIPDGHAGRKLHVITPAFFDYMWRAAFITGETTWYSDDANARWQLDAFGGVVIETKDEDSRDRREPIGHDEFLACMRRIAMSAQLSSGKHRGAERQAVDLYWLRQLNGGMLVREQELRNESERTSALASELNRYDRKLSRSQRSQLKRDVQDFRSALARLTAPRVPRGKPEHDQPEAGLANTVALAVQNAPHSTIRSTRRANKSERK
jgi:hypothetical protein